MGFSISWIAIKDKSPQDVLDYFGFSETGETEEFPDSDISSALLPNGWYMIWFNQCESPFVKSENMSKLSNNCSVVSCVVEEHVMYSSAEYWENGNRVWQIIHDAQQGIYDLQTSGQLPHNFESVKSEIIKKQTDEGGENAGVDYIFDIPLELLKQITCFKHDEQTPELEDQEFRVLVKNGTSTTESKPWWKIW